MMLEMDGIHPKHFLCTLKKAIQDAIDVSVCVNFWGQAHDNIHLLVNTSGGNSDVEARSSICIGKFCHCNCFKKRLLQWQW
jgi:hypothetical protein